jgi:hypothetical protein
VQSASADFIAAEAAQERRPIYRVSLDWNGSGYGGVGTIDDLTPQVEAITISREVKTDLPENVTLISGRSSASATITIGAGDTSTQAKTAAWYYSEDNTASPLFGLARQFRSVKIEVGFITASGPEYLTLFTGRTRDVQVDGSSGQVTIECLDASELFRGDRELPNVLASDLLDTGAMLKPGLNATFLIDWGLRRVGYYASPPPRANCKALATMHGSAWAEVGASVNVFSGLRAPFNFETGSFIEGLVMGGIDTTKIEQWTTETAPGVKYIFRMSTTRRIAIEGWIKVGSSVTDRGVFGIFSGTTGVGLYINASGPLSVYMRTPDSGPHNQNTALDPTDGNWHYVAICCTFGSNTVSTDVRMDGTTQNLGTPAGFNNTTTSPSPALTLTHIGKSFTAGGTNRALLGTIQDVQFSEEDISADWHDNFTPTATIAPSLAKMLAVPPLDGSLWDALDTLAAAEFGVLILSEAGYPTFYNRDTWETYGASVVMTLTTTTAVKSLVTNNPIDAVRNWIKVGGVAPSIKANSAIWRAASRIRIPGSGEDIGYGNGVRVFAFGYDGPIYNMDTSFIYASVVGVTESCYRAAQDIDGGGGNISNLTIVVTNQFASHGFISITNPNAGDVWLVNGEGIASVTPGQPTLAIYGQQVSFDVSDGSAGSGKLHVDKRDATSWNTYGQQLLELTDNPCRQDLDAFEGIADALLAQLKDPTRILRSLPIVGRPRLQLGDRVRITDTGGTALDGEFRITKLETSLSRSGGLEQTIDVREAV